MKHRPLYAALALAITAAAIPLTVVAWGFQGHTLINSLAAQSLPEEVPAFVRAPAAIAEITYLGPEEDRLKDAGPSWDDDNDPGHFLDIGDDGTLPGGIRLDALPKNMRAYTQALATAGTDPYKAGYLPYEIIDGFERVRKDFALWRVADYLSTHATTPAARERFAAERTQREDLTLRDIGDWGHFVGDAAQPLHITTHFNGWGDYPNPKNYTTEHIHAYFESKLVDEYAKGPAVRKLMPAFAPANPHTLWSQADIAKFVGYYLQHSASQVEPLYQLYASGDFQSGSPKAVTFLDEQLAAGAAMFRDLIAYAWEDSINATVGYPQVNVKDVLDGKVAPVTSD